VVTQLKTLTPVGTAMSSVAYMKYNWPVSGMPVTYMWWAQTKNEINPIAAMAYTIEV
jgi:hypothetical protein